MLQVSIQAALVAVFLTGLGFTSYRTYRNVLADVLENQHRDIKRLLDLPLRKLHAWKHIPRVFEPVFDERIEGRDLAVRRYARFKLECFEISSSSRVLMGQDGWLFFQYAADPSYYPPGHPRVDLIRSEWVKALPEWRQWLKDRNVDLLIVIAPNKQSIYPEYLPPLEQKRHVQAPLDCLLQELSAADPELKVLDLRPQLLDAKKSGQIYFRTDTHWNTDGMIVGYRETVKALGIAPLPAEAFHAGSGPTKEGDLTQLLGYWQEGPEPYDHWELRNPTACPVAVDPGGDEIARLDYLDTKAWERPEGCRRVVFFHDSFAAGFFSELLAEHFGRLLAVPSNHMDPAIIEREKPDIVILEIVERQFQGIGARGPHEPSRRSMVR
jgi:hypothetical protein